jgi:hypothetical protein
MITSVPLLEAFQVMMIAVCPMLFFNDDYGSHVCKGAMGGFIVFGSFGFYPVAGM